MDIEQQKASAFLTRLLSNPALSGYSELQKEEQIIQFLHINASQLAPTLSSRQFFSAKNWNQIYGILLEALFSLINNSFLPSLKTLITEKINFGFIPFFRQQNISNDKIEEQLHRFMITVLKRNEARRAFTGPYTALITGILDRYLHEVYVRKSYTHFELTKVQRLKMSKEEVKGVVQVTLLLKPVVYTTSVRGGVASQSELIPNQYAERLFQGLQKQLRYLPDQVLKSAVHANVSFNENRFIEATSRISAILASRSRNYRTNVKVDRGADTPDKSWLNIARRNYKYYGFDIKMLDEFYIIAAENGW